VSVLTFSRQAFRRVRTGLRHDRCPRTNLTLEILEGRQLLSTAAPDFNLFMAQPSVETVAQVSQPNPPGSNSQGSTLFPVFPSYVIVIVPFGTSHVVVVLPLMTTPTTLFGSDHPPVQQPQVSLAGPTSPGTESLNRFGQLATVDTLPMRFNRFENDFELTAMIDVVEPFDAPKPGAVPDKAAIGLDPAVTAMGSTQPQTTLPATDTIGTIESVDRGFDEIPPRILERGAFPLAVLAHDAEEQTTSVSSALAGVVVLASGGYWLTFSEKNRSKRHGPTLQTR
jgi:hypothetical protein